MERYRGEVENQLALGGREKLVIGGDFNPSVRRDSKRLQVYGRFGLSRGNEAVRELVE